MSGMSLHDQSYSSVACGWCVFVAVPRDPGSVKPTVPDEPANVEGIGHLFYVYGINTIQHSRSDTSSPVLALVYCSLFSLDDVTSRYLRATVRGWVLVSCVP